MSEVTSNKSLPELIAGSQDIRIGLLVVWIVGMTVFTLGGFYIGTIAGSPHIIDLQTKDINFGLKGAAAGAAFGFVFATLFTMIYPKARAAEEALEDAHH